MANEGLYTFVQLYNASGDSADLNGYLDPSPFLYPKQIGNGDSAWFVHTSDGSSDITAVVYYFNGDQLNWIVGWENTLNSQNNLVVTEIQPSLGTLRDHWASIKNKLKNPANNNESTSSYGGYLAHATIGDGNFPVLQAVLTKVNANN